MRMLVAMLAVGLLHAGAAVAGPFVLVEQERSYEWSTTSSEDPPTGALFEASDFGSFMTSGHDSTLSSAALVGDLSARGSASGPHPETETVVQADFRVVFDLLAPKTLDLDGRLEIRDPYFFDLGRSSLTLSFFDTGLGSFQPIFARNAPSAFGDAFFVDERFHDLPAGRYQLEATADGRGFWGSQGDITGTGIVEFTLTTPEPGTGVLAASMLACLVARRRRRSRAGA